jgi:hypothetical protein
MRRSLRAIVLALAAAPLAACAALTGLDKITEDDCVPDGCQDGATGPDAAHIPTPPDSGVDASADVAPWHEAAADAVSDAVSDSVSDTVSDSVSDGVSEAATDAPTDAPLDAPPDSSCGVLYLQEPFADNSRGWTLDTSWSIAPTCASPPAPQKGNPDPTSDHTGAAGSGIGGAYVCGNNPTGAKATARYMTSPAIDVSSAPALKLAFWRWLNTDASEYMASTVDVFDGSTWVNVYTNPSGAGNLVTDAAWTRQEYDVTAQKNAAFRVRFGYSIGSTSVYAMSVWNVDDVTLSTASCP